MRLWKVVLYQETNTLCCIPKKKKCRILLLHMLVQVHSVFKSKEGSHCLPLSLYSVSAIQCWKQSDINHDSFHAANGCTDTDFEGH